jgi:hypothetical protein
MENKFIEVTVRDRKEFLNVNFIVSVELYSEVKAHIITAITSLDVEESYDEIKKMIVG